MAKDHVDPVHQAKVQIEGERLIGAALDGHNKHAFQDELGKIPPEEQREALNAAKAYEAKREHGNPSLPKVEFFESNGKLGQVVVEENGKKPRVAYDSSKDGAQSTTDKVKDGTKRVVQGVKGMHVHVF